MTVFSLLALVLRFRRASPVERQQLKWLLFAVTVFALIYGITAVTAGELETGGLGDLLFIFSLMGIPVSIAVAVLKFHLYDLDRIIRRTLLYAVLTGLLIGIFALSVFVIQGVVGGVVGEDSPLGVAVSTLLVAALFNPLRRRLQDLIDSRLYREQIRRPEGYRRLRRHRSERGGHEPALGRSARCGRPNGPAVASRAVDQRGRDPGRLTGQVTSAISRRKRRALSVVGLTRT